MTKRTRRHTQDKDSAINAFMSKPEIFADLFNAYLYEGEQVIQPEALVPADRLLSEVIGNARGQAKLTRYRDVFMAYRDKNASYILLGIENQSAIHYAMPLRNMIYDALSLLARVRQKSARHLALKDLKRPDEFLSRFAKTDHIDPVFTLTVYYGHVPWDGPYSLHDMIRFPDEKLKRFIPDYFINLVVPAKLGDEMLARLNTELSEVFWCIRLAGNKEAFDAYIINHSKFKEMSYEAVQMINACTHANIPVKQDGEKVNMCQAIIDLKKEAYDNGFQKGEESGFQKGEESGILQSSSRIAINMYRSKYDMQEIVRMTGLTSEAIEKIVMAQPEERK